MNLDAPINQVKQAIMQEEMACSRPVGSVQLLAVSKGHPIEAIQAAHAAGLTSFGENYLQEALKKIQGLAPLSLDWHFIGSIQSNKTQAIAENFSWVHSLCQKKAAQLLNDKRPIGLPRLNVCIQVNIDAVSNKSGVLGQVEHGMALPSEIPHDIRDDELRIRDDELRHVEHRETSPDSLQLWESLSILARQIQAMPRLHLRGLMVIPEPSNNTQEQYVKFMQVNTLMQRLNTELNLSLDTLSMGMSDDMAAAIRAGSTIVRIGRRIFGERN